MSNALVSDDLWEHIAPLLPQPPERRYRYPGRLRVPDRVALAGIVYVLRKGVAWRDIPASVVGCSGVTAWRRHRLTPARVRRGFRHIRPQAAHPAQAPKPSRPGPGRPPGRKNTRPTPRPAAQVKDQAGCIDPPQTDATPKPRTKQPHRDKTLFEIRETYSDVSVLNSLTSCTCWSRAVETANLAPVNHASLASECISCSEPA